VTKSADINRYFEAIDKASDACHVEDRPVPKRDRHDPRRDCDESTIKSLDKSKAQIRN